MKNQNLRLILYSSIAILALMVAWGIRHIPKQSELAEQTLKSSVEQELLVLSSAVRASTQALRFKLLDVLKSDEKTSLGDSPFVAVALLEWDGMQWKSNWHLSANKGEFASSEVRAQLKGWPLAKLVGGDTYIARINETASQPYFAVAVPVRKGSSSMIGVGVFSAASFGLNFPADRTREVKIVDDKGFALALNRPAYLGVSLRTEPLIAQLIESEEISARNEWKNDSGRIYGVATRLGESNLIASIETPVRFGAGYIWQGWLYLLMCAAAAIALNWWLLNSLLRPLFEQIANSDAMIEQLKRSAAQGVTLSTTPPPAPILAKPELEDYSFIEPKVEEPTKTSLAKVVQAALRSLESRIRENDIKVQQAGLEDIQLEADPLQLQTAIEEVVKNSIEAMERSEPRVLTIMGQQKDGHVHLTLEDTGCGIPHENQSKVFDPFFSTKDSQGVSRGLGLNVVRRVIEELRGEVRITSLDAGTTVELDWPETTSVAPVVHEEAPQTLELDEEDDFETMIMEAPLVPSSARGKRELPADVSVRKPKVRTLD